VNALRRVLGRLAASLLDGFAALTGFYYSKKYAAIARRLGLRPAETGDAAMPGLIIIQVDGLAYDHLLQRIRQGQLPHIQRMIERGEMAAARWRCGLPSTTPACQAGIMFGDNSNIPAFRWYDKERGVSMVCKLPATVTPLQDELTRDKVGILTNGSSYVNVFDGDAASSLFTLSSMHPRRLFENVRGMGLVGLFLLNPLRAIRIVYLSVKEYAAGALESLWSRLRGEPGASLVDTFPLLRVFSNVVFRELVTFAVLVDIYRGVPVIYTTYFGYDAIAHHLGLDSLVARQALRDIDGRIGQIDRLRRAQLTRSYALVLLGDHGLTASQPFSETYGKPLGQYIAELLGQGVYLVEGSASEQHYQDEARFLLAELRAIEKNLPPRAAKVAHRIRFLVRKRLRRDQRALPEWNVEKRYDVVVKSSGSLAHVYLNISKQQLDLSEVSTAFPGLVVKLLAHEGIWLVVGRDGARTLIMARNGILSLDGASESSIEGENPLRRLPEPWLAAQQIHRIARFAQSGDLMLFGAYDTHRNTVVAFEKQRAAHGGLGGPQDYPFIAYPRLWNWDLSTVENSCDLYGFLAQHRSLPST